MSEERKYDKLIKKVKPIIEEAYPDVYVDHLYFIVHEGFAFRFKFLHEKKAATVSCTFDKGVWSVEGTNVKHQVLADIHNILEVES